MTLLSRLLVVFMPLVFLIGVSTASAQKKDPDLLTEKEIAEHPNLNNAFEAVQQLRPRFFRGSTTWTVEGSGGGHPDAGSDPSGGSSQSDGILVVVDGVRRGGVEELKIIPATEMLKLVILVVSSLQAMKSRMSG